MVLLFKNKINKNQKKRKIFTLFILLFIK